MTNNNHKFDKLNGRQYTDLGQYCHRKCLFHAYQQDMSSLPNLLKDFEQATPSQQCSMLIDIFTRLASQNRHCAYILDQLTVHGLALESNQRLAIMQEVLAVYHRGAAQLQEDAFTTTHTFLEQLHAKERLEQAEANAYGEKLLSSLTE